jgi:hypothetical protein
MPVPDGTVFHDNTGVTCRMIWDHADHRVVIEFLGPQEMKWTHIPKREKRDHTGTRLNAGLEALAQVYL